MEGHRWEKMVADMGIIDMMKSTIKPPPKGSIHSTDSTTEPVQLIIAETRHIGVHVLQESIDNQYAVIQNVRDTVVVDYIPDSIYMRKPRTDCNCRQESQITYHNQVVLPRSKNLSCGGEMIRILSTILFWPHKVQN